jgi:serine/threonine protein phosphatase PrpC
MERYGGNPKCIICEPEIHVVKITDQTDFVLIGSDGIFDKISTEECVQVIMQETDSVLRDNLIEERGVNKLYDPESFDNVSEVCGIVTDRLLTNAMECESMDNLSVAILTFGNFTRYLKD